MRHIASVSWGKDSLAMLIYILENHLPLDEVVFYDTGMEFQAIYNNRDKMLYYLKQKGIKYTELKPKRPFLYDMLERPKTKRTGETVLGTVGAAGRAVGEQSAKWPPSTITVKATVCISGLRRTSRAVCKISKNTKPLLSQTQE